MKSTKLLKISLKLISGSAYFLFALTLISAISYFFGYKILAGGLVGNDAPNSFTFITWLDKFYPEIPLWFPLQGSGVSFVQGYQVFPHLVVVWLHRFTSLTLIQSFGVINFLIMPLSALSLYFFAWNKFKNQTVAFVSAVFYLLSPFGWNWVIVAGFFSQAFSFIFFPLALLFIDRYLDDIWDKKSKRIKLIDFMLAVLFSVLLTLSHIFSIAALFVLIFIYVIIYLLIKLRQKKIKLVGRTILNGSLLALFILGLSAFWVISYYTYQSLANWDGSNNLNDPHFFPKTDVQSMLSLPSTSLRGSSVWTFSMPIFMWVLAFISMPLAFLYRRRFFIYTIVYAISFYGSVSNDILLFFGKFTSSMLLISILTPRLFWIIFQFLAPLLAAFSLWAIAKFLFKLMGRLPRVRKINKIFSFFFAPLFTLAFALFVIVQFKSPDLGISSFAHYGSVSLYPNSRMNLLVPSYAGGLDLRDIWEKGYGECGEKSKCVTKGDREVNCLYNVEREIAQECERGGYRVSWGSFLNQLKIENWPKLILADDKEIKDIENFFSSIPKNKRIDISPVFGGYIERVNIARTDLSIINIYTYTLPLNHSFWGMQAGAFYSSEEKDPINTSTSQLVELAKWFGTNYVLLSPSDPIQRYEKAGIFNIKKGSPIIASLKTQMDIFELSDKPSVLVIGKWGNRAYEQVFRNGIKGAIPYSKYYLVMGKENIDDYSLDELSKFSVVTLQAYSYKNRASAWNLLDNYVKNGGSLFVDTGWQFNVPEWELNSSAQMPLVFPMKSLEWLSLPTNGKYKLEDVGIEGVDVSQFGPLVWDNTSWGVSSSKSIADWASPVLTYGGYPLVTEGIYGRGKVVWSGMNLFSHSLDKNSEAEISFLSKLFDYLSEGRTGSSFISASISRDNPDKVYLTVNENVPENTNLIFREAFSPNWKGYVQNSNGLNSISLFRGGPGLIYAKLPSMAAGDKIILEYKYLLIQELGYPISLITLVIMIIYLIDIVLLKERIVGLIKKRLKMSTSLPLIEAKRRVSAIDEENDY